MALLNFKYGNQSSLPAFAQAEQGTVYVTKDTNRLFIALPEGSDYMNTGDFQLVTFSSGTAAAALAALTSSLKRTNILYVTVDTANNNATAMWRYTGSAFVAISNTAEIDGIKGDITALQTAVNALNEFKDTTVPATYMPIAGEKSFTGNVGFVAGKYLTVNTPSADGHAATKKYVDDAKSGLLGNSSATTTNGATIYDVKRAAAAAQTTADSAATAASNANTNAEGRVSKGGDTMTGLLTLSGDPTKEMHAATKQYVDSKGNSALSDAKKYTDEREAIIMGDENSSADSATVHGVKKKAEANATAINTINNNIEGINTALDGKAPTNHASTKTTYGIGTGTNYGHVKVTDAVNTTQTNGQASKGLAASAYAVKLAYDKGAEGLQKANDAYSKAENNTTAINDLNTDLGNNYVKRDGTQAMTGALTLIAANPTNAQHAAHKKYVDEAKAGAESTAQGYVNAAKTAILGTNDDGSNYVGTVKDAYAAASAASTAASNAQNKADAAMPKAGGTFTGDVAFASGEYLTINAPRSGDVGKKDAATREYVDAAENSAVNTVKGLATDNENSATIVGAKKYTDVQINTVNSTINTLKKDIGNLTNIMNFLGTTDSDVKQDATITKIIVGDSEVTVTNGDVVIKGAKEFVFDGSKWQEIGDVSAQSTAITNLQNTVGTKPSTPTMDNTLWEEVADLRSDLGESGATAGTGSAFTRIKTLETWKGSHATEYTNLEKRVDDLETFESDHTTKYNSLKSTVDNHTTAIGATGDAASANGSLYARIKQNYNDINTASTGLKARVSALETWKGTHTTAYTNLSNAVSANSKAIDALALLLTWETF